MSTTETPAEWLEAEFDRLDGRARIPRLHERPIFELLNDHPRTACAGFCMSGYASWPTPRPVDDMDDANRWAA